MPVPTAVVLVTIGILLYPSPVLPYLIGGLLTVGVLFIFILPKTMALLLQCNLVAVVLVIFTLMAEKFNPVIKEVVLSKRNIQLYTRYPFANILTYNGTTIIHYLLVVPGLFSVIVHGLDT